MTETYEVWDANEWEQHAYGLLRDRHGPLNVYRVPARHGGDHGVDYYSLADRVAYQCYAVLEPCDVAARAENQRAKMTTDLRKFCTNKKELLTLFGGVRIERWVLLVPHHDSARLNAHCTKKTRQVRGMVLPYVASTFEVMVQDLESFDAASRRAREFTRRSVTLPRLTASKEDIERWASASQILTAKLAVKLRKRVIPNDSATLEDHVAEAIGWFLERENSMEHLRQRSPELHEVLLELIARRTQRLTLYGPPQEGAPGKILREAHEELLCDLREGVPNLSGASAELVALGTLAEWLMLCPLNFPPYDDAN